VICYSFTAVGFPPGGSGRIHMYRVAHEKPARRLLDQRGRRFRTLYRKLCKCKVLTG